MREIVFDTETTGLDPSQGDRIVEIGCIEIVNRVETGRTFHAYFNPECPMPSIAEQVHGLGDAFLADKPRFDERVEDLLDFLEDSPLVAHNAMFDFAFLNAELGRSGRFHIPMARMVDTLALAKTRHPGAKHSLDALCSRYGIDRSHRVHHGALLDAQLLVQVYVELTGGRQIGLDIPVPGEERPSTASAAARQGSPLAVAPPMPVASGRTPRLATVSAEEEERHRAFIETLTDPIWSAPRGR